MFVGDDRTPDLTGVDVAESSVEAECLSIVGERSGISCSSQAPPDVAEGGGLSTVVAHCPVQGKGPVRVVVRLGVKASPVAQHRQREVGVRPSGDVADVLVQDHGPPAGAHRPPGGVEKCVGEAQRAVRARLGFPVPQAPGRVERGVLGGGVVVPVAAVVEHPLEHEVSSGAGLVVTGLLGGVCAEQVVAGESTGAVFSQQVCAGQADVLVQLADTHRAAGNARGAGAARQQALSVLDSLHHHDADRLRARIRRL
jgi:hypothetical protein